MKKDFRFIVLIVLVFLFSACGNGGGSQPAGVPEFHPIEYDTSLDTLDDDYGADAFDHALDHPDTRYHFSCPRGYFSVSRCGQADGKEKAEE